MAEAEHGGDGLFDSGRRIASSIIGLLQNRLSLAAVELQEEKLRVISLLVWLCVALVLATAGILVAIAERFGLPINAIGIGEGLEDFEPFDADDFAGAIAGAGRQNDAAA